MEKKPLPIGVDDFEKLINYPYYYVDKTLMLRDLIKSGGDINLYTRPRRFGKSLNLSMIHHFFEVPAAGENKAKLFEGLKIMDAGEDILSHMGKYPVIHLSLKGGKQRTFELAFRMLADEIQGEFIRHRTLEESRRLSPGQRDKFSRIMNGHYEDSEVHNAIKFLSDCLASHYGVPAIILIDEYDVPLENAYFEGFYEEMIGFIRSLFESALKTNTSLHFAVITGCLRISRESIFTGLNNLKMNSILSQTYDEYFGFTPAEVESLLDYYHLEAKKEEAQNWNDGSVFGNAEVYNPWSIINYTEEQYHSLKALPVPYWSNTSSNSIVRRLIDQASMETRQELEALVEGESIEKPIYEDITYGDVDKSQDNLWNFLFFTGYLRKTGQRMGPRNTRYVSMTIPNEEIRYIYMNSIMDWFDHRVKSRDFTPLYHALLTGDTATMAESLADELLTSISFYDYNESFYHGFMVGVLKGMADYIVISNQESGKGRPDLLVKYPSVRGLAIIIEFKVTRDYEELEAVCDTALAQIIEMDYQAGLYKEGYRKYRYYGIGFYKKEVCVKTMVPPER